MMCMILTAHPACIEDLPQRTVQVVLNSCKNNGPEALSIKSIVKMNGIHSVMQSILIKKILRQLCNYGKVFFKSDKKGYKFSKKFREWISGWFILHGT